tara:strand:- start:1961 stop:2341 length:381 start_codon:yes stop_codon:yes gene_type:complete
MALENFRASSLPNPGPEYDPQYIRQLIRTIEIYFSQLDSQAPNHAQSYRASRFIGGQFEGFFPSYTSAEKAVLAPDTGTVVFDTTLGKLCVYSGSLWETLTSVPVTYAMPTSVSASGYAGTVTTTP